MHEERFLGTVVYIDYANQGAKIRPIWANGSDEKEYVPHPEDLFCSFKESCKLREGMKVSFSLDKEERTGRWAAIEVSDFLIDVLVARPAWLPNAKVLDAMRKKWNATHLRREVEAVEARHMNRVLNNSKEEINSVLDGMGLKVSI